MHPLTASYSESCRREMSTQSIILNFIISIERKGEKQSASLPKAKAGEFRTKRMSVHASIEPIFLWKNAVNIFLWKNNLDPLYLTV